MNYDEPVKYWDYLPAYFRNRQEILKITDEVFSSGRLILGSRVDSFEKNFAKFCGTAFGIGVNSCTDALFLALKALGIKEGDEVITVSNTAVPTVAAIRAAGATPVFVDVEPDTYLMNTSLLERLVSIRTRCIIPVHLCGQAVSMGPLLDIAAKHGLSVIEDCAQAAGASYKGTRVGSFGQIGAFSFYPTKILGAFGDAGMLTTSSEQIAGHLRCLRFYGMKGEYYSEEEGYNSRLDELQAAILDFMLIGLEKEVRQRQIIADRYSKGLGGVGDILLPVTQPERDHRYYLYTIRTGRRDELKKFLSGFGIEARINYPYPIHLMRGYAILGYKEGDLPVTERLAEEILSLPMYGDLPMKHVDRVINAVKCFFAGVAS
ncbi:MAG: DegT/DnrJ/EryC1/StrS family aminotransferase [Geobacteraceae bacterium]|nr:DegT/DnrJ/EryC1/StrS family aminotransferase [Geobacteraceae bacterium]